MSSSTQGIHKLKVKYEITKILNSDSSKSDLEIVIADQPVTFFQGSDKFLVFITERDILNCTYDLKTNVNNSDSSNSV